MKNQLNIKAVFIYALLTFSMLFSSCHLIGQIFKAGLFVGIIAVVVIVAVVLWIISAIFGRR